MYDLNQIPYHYTMEETKRFEGLDLTEWLKRYGQRFIFTGGSDQDCLQGKEMQKGKMVVRGGLTNS